MPWPEERGMVLGDRSCGAGRGAAGTSRPSCPSSGSRISIFSYHGHTQTPPPAPSRGELQVFLLHPQESRFLSDFLFWAIGLLPSSGSAGRAGEPRGLGGGTASSWGRCSKGSCWLGGSTGGSRTQHPPRSSPRCWQVGAAPSTRCPPAALRRPFTSSTTTSPPGLASKQHPSPSSAPSAPGLAAGGCPRAAQSPALPAGPRVNPGSCSPHPGRLSCFVLLQPGGKRVANKD